MSNYCTVQNLKDFRPTGAPSTIGAVIAALGHTDAELQTILDRAEEIIDKGTNNKFIVFADTVFADGKDTQFMFLPQDANFKHPIVTVTSLQEVDFDQSEVLTVLTELIDYQIEAHYIRLNDSHPTRLRQFVSGERIFFKGTRNYKIVGTFGRTPIPEGIKQAVLMLSVIYTLGEGSVGFGDASGDRSKIQESWTDYTVTHGSGADANKRRIEGIPNITGYLEIDRLLEPHINYSDIMMLP